MEVWNEDEDEDDVGRGEQREFRQPTAVGKL